MEKIFAIDPYQSKHIELIEQFEQKNSFREKLSSYLHHITATIPREEYLKKKKKDNSFEEFIILEESDQIKDICQIQGERDRKTCQIIFPVPSTNIKRRNLILQATDFSMSNLGMMEVMVQINSEDKELASFLENKGYENLGNENGIIIFLKDNIRDLERRQLHESTR